jgi:hypothetical protein
MVFARAKAKQLNKSWIEEIANHIRDLKGFNFMMIIHEG